MELPIYKTSKYDIFTKLDGNRDIDDVKVNNLVKSFNKNHIKTIIIANEKLQIIDGQHRLEASKITNKPVHFIIVKGYGLTEAIKLNTNKKN